MKTLCFLVNPICLKKNRSDLEDTIATIIDPTQFSFTIQYSESCKHLSQLARECVKSQVDIIAAVGGDGTVHQVGKELIHSESSLAIIPMGSGNGLARHIGISTIPEIALQQLQQGHVQRMDTISVGKTSFLNVSGIGFDGHVAVKFDESKVRGFWTYVRTVVKEYFSYKPMHYSVLIDGEECVVEAFLIAICNGSQYGNKAVIAPQAKIEDGHLDVVIITPFPVLLAPLIAFRLFCGTLKKSLYVQVFRGENVEISGQKLDVHLDGEPLTKPNNTGKVSLLYQVNPISLSIITP